tara:strand:+ start:112534 stop:113007 length:474 start_codon:yes stop_codon:yes gene_type:complete
MRTTLFISSLLSLFFGMFAFAGPHGGGLLIGDISGITYKYKNNARIEWDGHLGLIGDDLDGRVRRLHASKKLPFIKKPIKNVHWYWGYGLAYKRRDKIKDGNEVTQNLLGPTAPIGARVLFQDPLTEIFVELSLSTYLAPEFEAELGGGLGIRFFFD